MVTKAKVRRKQSGVILRGMERHPAEWRWIKTAAAARETNAATIIARMVKLTKAIQVDAKDGLNIVEQGPAKLLTHFKLELVTR